jgi:hypothetical protein
MKSYLSESSGTFAVKKHLLATLAREHSRTWRVLKAYPEDRLPFIGEAMQFALLIYEPPEIFATRKYHDTDPYLGAWRAYYKALVEAAIYVGGDALEVPETGTTLRVKEGRGRVEDGPYADTKEQLAGVLVLELPSLDAALHWAERCPAASAGAVEVRPLAPQAKVRITG